MFEDEYAEQEEEQMDAAMKDAGMTWGAPDEGATLNVERGLGFSIQPTLSG